MKPEEEKVLQKFLEELVSSRADYPDADAQQMIQRAVSQQPQAAYLLTQRAIWLEQHSLQLATQLAALQEQLVEARAQKNASSFLDKSSEQWGNSAPASGLGAGQGGGWQNDNPAARSPVPGMGPGSYPGPAAPPQPYYPPQQAPQSGWMSGGLGSFMGTAAATGAGMLAGSMLYNGIESMLHRHEANQSSHSSNNLASSGEGQSNNLLDAPGMAPDDQTRYAADNSDSASGSDGLGLFDNDSWGDDDIGNA